MSKHQVKIEDFAKTIHKLLKSDRDVVVGVGGFTGSGKTTFSTKLGKSYCKVAAIPWTYGCMTWDRDEMMKWIDGKKKSEVNQITGLREGQKPEYSLVLADELFYMFYRRTWFEDGQISAVATFNMCRDRHLLVIGNVPDFWDLDGGFIKRVRFYAYIYERGRAWIFQQENNPFTKDPWNVNDNKKMFRKYKNPYTIPNFICEIHFDDWSKEEKKEYNNIRNEKRIKAIQKGKVKKERYKDIKDQRDNCINGWVEDRKQLSEALTKVLKNVSATDRKLLLPWKGTPSNEFVADVIGISRDAVRMIKTGER